jgi:hypothetical protein
MKIITNNFIIMFNEDNSIKYVQSRFNGKFANHKLALAEYQLEMNEETKTIFALSSCILSLITVLAFIYVNVDIGALFTLVTLFVFAIGKIYTFEKENNLLDEILQVQTNRMLAITN